MIDLWYKNSVIYSLNVETFQDSNDDGIGDFRGLTERLDYLSSLGVTCPEIGWGDWRVLDTGDPAVFAHRCDWSGAMVVAVHNLADRPAAVRLGTDLPPEPMVELLGDQPYQSVESDRQIALEPYGYRWFRIGGARRFLF